MANPITILLRNGRTITIEQHYDSIRIKGEQLHIMINREEDKPEPIKQMNVYKRTFLSETYSGCEVWTRDIIVPNPASAV